MLLPHAAGVFHNLKTVMLCILCSLLGYSLKMGLSGIIVYYMVCLDIPLRRDYQQLLCILCSFFGHSLNMGLSYFVYGLK